jgi:hypothetical protein
MALSSSGDLLVVAKTMANQSELTFFLFLTKNYAQKHPLSLGSNVFFSHSNIKTEISPTKN